MCVCVHGQREREKAQRGWEGGRVVRGCCLGKSSEESCFSWYFGSGRHTQLFQAPGRTGDGAAFVHGPRMDGTQPGIAWGRIETQKDQHLVRPG